MRRALFHFAKAMGATIALAVLAVFFAALVLGIEILRAFCRMLGDIQAGAEYAADVALTMLSCIGDHWRHR